MAKASDIIKQAQKWLGKKEADGSFKEIINVYNGHKPLARGVAVQYHNEWCATFVSAVAIMCNATDIMPTECGCERMIELYKKIGCWIENENRVPNVGDLIYYDWADGKNYATTDNKAWSDHIGIVEKIEGSKITVIEGNYNSAVARRVLEVNGRYIRGYAVPKYEKEAAPKPSTTVSSTPSPYYAKYTGTSTSLDTMLKAIGVPSKFYGNWMKRKPIAAANGIANYKGKEEQNILLKRLAKQGKLKRA
jgi:hypothetical protein